MDSAKTSSNASLNPTKCTIYVVFFPLPFSCIYLNWQNWHLGRFAFTIADQLYVLCCMPDCLQSMASLFTYVFTVSNRVIKSSFVCSFVSVLSSLSGRKLLSSFIVAAWKQPLPNHYHIHVVYAYACKRSRKPNGLLYYIRVVCHVHIYQTNSSGNVS